MTGYPFPKASLKHRLSQAFLEYGLFIVTLGVGYIVWFWISLGNGQTPGKQILKLLFMTQPLVIQLSGVICF